MLINQEVNEKVNESKLSEVRATVRVQGIPKHHGKKKTLADGEFFLFYSCRLRCHKIGYFALIMRMQELMNGYECPYVQHFSPLIIAMGNDEDDPKCFGNPTFVYYNHQTIFYSIIHKSYK